MVIPSSIEEHLGQVWDPKNAKDEIGNVNNVIDEFIESMRQGRVPKSGIDQIAEATDILGLYAGYPGEAADFEGYIKSDIAVSYQEVAGILQGFAAEMNVLIETRLKYSQPQDTITEQEINESNRTDDIPF